MEKNNPSGLISKVLIAGTLAMITFGNLGCISVLQDLGKDVEGLTECKIKVTYRGSPNPSASAHMEEEGVYPLIPPY